MGVKLSNHDDVRPGRSVASNQSPPGPLTHGVLELPLARLGVVAFTGRAELAPIATALDIPGAPELSVIATGLIVGGATLYPPGHGVHEVSKP